jgi:hypothetical protein
MIWFLLAILAVGLLILAVVMQSSQPTKSKRRKSSAARTGTLDREFVSRKWADIQIMIAGRGGSLRDAVSEADKLVDYALKQSGVPGDTMGERLKNSRGRFSNIDDIWSAHKLRNALAHEADFDLVPDQARQAVTQFERGLKDLGAL